MIKGFLIFTISALFSLSSLAAEEVVNIEKPEATEATTLLAEPVALKTAAEDQIPLNIDVTKKSADAPPASSRILLTGIVLVGMLSAAYYLVRKYKTSNTINKSNTQIKVISQHYLGPKKSLAIIHVAGESILVGITDSNISMIKSLSLIDDEVPAQLPKNFTDAMTNSNKAPAAGASATSDFTLNENELDEEFSFAGLKDTVSKKIKSMRSI